LLASASATVPRWPNGRAHLDRFDVLEITADHCIHGGAAQRALILSDASPSTRMASGFLSARIRHRSNTNREHGNA
jgi:hypothetical protein